MLLKLTKYFSIILRCFYVRHESVQKVQHILPDFIDHAVQLIIKLFVFHL